MADDIESPIWQLWQQSTRHHWCWPCPHCGEYFVPRFNLMRYPPKVSPMAAARETYLECPHCGGVIEDGYKAAMNERGQYVAPGQTIDGNGQVSGDLPDTMSVSYWVSGLASPFVSFDDRIPVSKLSRLATTRWCNRRSMQASVSCIRPVAARCRNGPRSRRRRATPNTGAVKSPRACCGYRSPRTCKSNLSPTSFAAGDPGPRHG
nr:phage terminase large subunit family protein [Bradyrhizobium lablabi]